MRYFRWGVSRLLLESPVQPIFVPMFISGFDKVMNEARRFLRFVPRVGKAIRITYGTAVPDERFKDMRAEWWSLWKREGGGKVEHSEVLRTGKEAVELRIETTRLVREEITNLRRSLGFPDEEPGVDDPQTYSLPSMPEKEGKLVDGTTFEDT